VLQSSKWNNDQEPYKAIAMEAICIKDRTSSEMAMNFDLGLNLNPVWNSVLVDKPDGFFQFPFTSYMSVFLCELVTGQVERG